MPQPTIAELTNELRSINDNVEDATDVTLAYYPDDGSWTVFIGDERDRVAHFGGLSSIATLPGFGARFTNMEVQATARDLIEGLE